MSIPPQLGALYDLLSRSWHRLAQRHRTSGPTEPAPQPDVDTVAAPHRLKGFKDSSVRGFKGSTGSRAELVPPLSRPTLEPWKRCGRGAPDRAAGRSKSCDTVGPPQSATGAVR